MDLSTVLLDAARAGASGVAVVPSPGAPPQIAWTPRDERREPAFLIYSITKTFTATLLLQLETERRLSLDDRLSTWFPRVPGAEGMSLRQVLNHTAGLRDYGPLRAYHDAVRSSPAAPWSFDRFAAETVGKGVLFEPGAAFEYSNPGYMLLKRIAEEVAGDSYADLVRERIARPLGLPRTFVAESAADLAVLAPARSTLVSADGSAHDVRDRYHPGWVSHGVVASTPSDVARFFDALSSGRIVGSVSRMTTLVPVAVPGDDPMRALLGMRRPGYGLGVMGDAESQHGVIWGHNGGGPGYSTSAFHAPDLGGVSICAMTSTEGLDAVRIVSAVLQNFAGRA